MRVRRLELEAFGPFTGVSVAFGEAGCVDVVYGSNEAGKSTCLRGWVDLFCGFQTKTGDGFLHGVKRLRIGAEAVNGGGEELRFFRRKGNKNTLLDAEGGALDEGVMERFGAGVGRDVFSALYLLGREELEEGREALLAGQGKAGEALFSAGLGGAAVNGLLDKLEGRSRELFVARGKGQVLNVALRELKEKREELRVAQLAPAEWEEERAELESAGLAREKLVAELGEKRSLLERKRRYRSAATAAGRYLKLREAVGGGVDVALLAEDFGERVREAEEGAKVSGVKLVEAEAEVKRLRGEVVRLEAAEEAGDDAAVLRAVLEEAGGEGDLEARWRESESERKAKAKRVDVLLGRLNLWVGTAGELGAVRVPGEETVGRFVKRWEAAGLRVVEAERRLGEVRDELGRAAVQLGELEGGGEVPSREGVTGARARRDDLWREGLGGEEAVRFLQSVEAADEAADALWREADRAAQVASLKGRRSVLQERLGVIEGELAGAVEEVAVVKVEWEVLWGGVLAGQVLPPREMVGWLRERAVVLEVAVELESAELRALEVRERAVVLKGRLVGVLGGDLGGANLRGLLGEVRGREERLREAAVAAGQVREALGKAEARLEGTRAEGVRWEGELAGLVRAAGCGEAAGLGAVVELAGVTRVLEDAGGGEVLEDFVRAAAAVDAVALGNESVELEGEVEGLERERAGVEERLAEAKGRFRKLDGGDAAAVLAGEVAALEATVREAAEEWLRVRVARSMLSAGAERYREANEGVLVARAGGIICGADRRVVRGDRGGLFGGGRGGSGGCPGGWGSGRGGGDERGDGGPALPGAAAGGAGGAPGGGGGAAAAGGGRSVHHV